MYLSKIKVIQNINEAKHFLRESKLFFIVANLFLFFVYIYEYCCAMILTHITFLFYFLLRTHLAFYTFLET